ncbi:MAG: RING finger domain-containing protein [Promethearchaeota archaeon]
MLNCIICHMEIVEGKDILRKCSNDHPVHDECLKEWLLHSPNCPLCNTPYSQDIIDQSKDYLKEKEKDKISKEREKKIEEIAENMVYLKITSIFEELVNSKKYDEALDKLDTININNLPKSQKQEMQFIKGKIFYLKGRYDMAIGHLFKLVKERYDYPEAFLYLGKAYQELGLEDKAQWAFERVPK